MEQPIMVHATFGAETVPVGTVWMHDGPRAAASFKYSDTWLQDPRAYPIEPSLPLGVYAFHTMAKQPLFASMSDSTPDRWGQRLIQRKHAAGRRNSSLVSRDYLLGVSDFTRIGALRYSLDGAEFLANGNDVPPLARLAELMAAADGMEEGDGTPTQLELLLAPGSSLGGARPKANVVDGDGNLFIAKFERPQDTYPVIAWEAATLQIAKSAGITVPETRLLDLDGRKVLLVKRFDRDGENRIPYLSALSMLNAADAESGSYVELASAIRQHGADVLNDLREMWRRLVFTILVTNTDNHLRNHAFVRASNGWSLAPAYDINPTPRSINARLLTLPVVPGDAVASLSLALSVASDFGLSDSEAWGIIGDVAKATSNWRSHALAVGINRSEASFIETAFEHGELELALRGRGQLRPDALRIIS